MKIGVKIIRLSSVDSTNNYVANLVKVGKIDSGTVVLADEQSDGKGQRGAVWLSSAGENLTFSFYLENVNLSVEKQFTLTQLVSLSLIHLLSRLGVDARIKWPNDIVVKNRKIAGVLIENQLAGSEIKSSIVGVGLNVNQVIFKGLNATSLFSESGLQRAPVDILMSFIDAFNTNELEFADQSGIKKDYLKNLYQFQELANYKDSNGKFEGKIIDVLTSGKLVLQVENERREYDLKEIKFL
tara:strand:+ start:36363 stop:37085 length:723 start_codon:yes stop_codon:yes gene_type:complete